MAKSLPNFAAAHRQVLEIVARAAEFDDPVAFNADNHYAALLKAARKGRAFAIDGVLVYDWDPSARKAFPGVKLGGRLYEIAGVRFGVVQFNFDFGIEEAATNFIAVERSNYRRLYRMARRCLEDAEPGSAPPVLPRAHADALWENTIGYLESDRLERIRAFG